MQRQIKSEEIDRRLTALEKAVASLLAQQANAQHREVPSGRFAHLGGIERRGPTTHQRTAAPIDFSRIGGKRVK